MGTKKDIGKVFKERFKDFEETPDAGIWDSIAAELDKNKRNRIAPLWYYVGGLIVIGLFTSIWFFTKDYSNPKPQQDTIVETPLLLEKEKVNNDSKLLVKTEKDIDEKYLSKTTNAENTESTEDAESSKKNSATANTNVKNKKQQLVNSNNRNSLRSTIKEEVTVVQEEVTVATIKNLIAAEQARRNKANKEDLANYTAKNKKNQELAIQKQRNESAREVAERLAANQKKTKKNKSKGAENKKRKRSDDKDPKTTEEREEDREESVRYSIAISPYTSILSYGSLSKASSIDDRLVNNPRRAISTVGYGIRAEYTLSERTRLRLGVGYAPLKYKTDNFQVSITNGSVNIYELSAISFQNLNQGSGTTANSPEAISFFNENNVVSIQQNISYLEVPLDFQYMFLNKRIGLSVSPGVSLFILNDNSIFATAENGQSLFVGRESNLNGLSLAFNFGLGAHYNLNSKWRLNVEPVFRYQLNPYSNSLSNFRPYYIGGQFGMSYKF